MRDPLDDLDLGAALRDGLRALPVPAVAPDFDARVLDALRAPLPWWRRLWEPARPLLLGASCSLSVTLVLLHWTLTAPAPRPPILGGYEKMQADAPLRLPQNWGFSGAGRGGPAPSLDRLLDRPDLRAGSLASAWAVPPPPERRPEPPRHAQAGRRAALIV